MNITAYLEDQKLLDISKVEANRLTYLNYAFAGIKDNLISHELLIHIDSIKNLKKINPKLKTNICIGGLGAKTFSDAVLTESTRSVFIGSIIDFLERYSFDGVDIDWEYPCSSSCGFVARPDDRHNFSLFIKELREKFNKLEADDGKHRMISIAAGAGQDYIDNTEPIILCGLLDYVNLMTYDFHNSHEKMTGHHTNLFNSKNDPDPFCAEDSVNKFIKAGFPPEKINLGATFYGWGWKDVGSRKNGLYRPAEVGVEYSICYHELLKDFINKNGFERYWDDEAKAPYLSNGKDFITYEDAESIGCKLDFAKKRHLAGIMIWEYSQDETGALIKTISDGACR